MKAVLWASVLAAIFVAILNPIEAFVVAEVVWIVVVDLFVFFVFLSAFVTIGVVIWIALTELAGRRTR